MENLQASGHLSNRSVSPIRKRSPSSPIINPLPPPEVAFSPGASHTLSLPSAFLRQPHATSSTAQPHSRTLSGSNRSPLAREPSLPPALSPLTPQRPHLPTEKMLSRLYGVNSKFRSSTQHNVVADCLKGQRNFVAVMPTGSGKSAAFFLPPLIAEEQSASGYTIVMLPNHALLQDVTIRAKAINLPYHIWTADSSHPGPGVRLILIALESITSETFRG